MWFIFALLSAIFAAVTSILAKIGIEKVNSNLATAIRTMVVVVMAWGMVFLTHTQGFLSELRRILLDLKDRNNSTHNIFFLIYTIIYKKRT